MAAWAETGRPIDEFWSLTCRQILLVFRGEAKRVDRETRLQANLAAYQVWRLAHLMRLKRLPRKPDDLMKTKRISTGDDWRAQKAAIELLNAALSGSDARKRG